MRSSTKTRIIAGIAILAGLGAFLFGFDTGIAARAGVQVRQRLDVGVLGGAWITGCLVAGAFTGGGLAVAWNGARVRRRARIAGAGLAVCAAVASAYSSNLVVLCAAAYALGLTFGAHVPARRRPAAHRRRAAPIAHQAFVIAMGSLSMYAVFAVKAFTHDWRWAVGLVAVPATALSAGAVVADLAGRGRTILKLPLHPGVQAGATLGVAAAALVLATAVHESVHLSVSLGRSVAGAVAADITDNAPHVDMRTATPHRAYVYLQDEFGMSGGFLRMRRTSLFIPLWANTLTLQAYAALALLSGRNHARYERAYRHALAALSYYWTSDGARSGYFPHVPLFYPERGVWDDDNAWIGLIMMRDYRLRHDAASLATAKRLFASLIRQWDPRGGGIFWQMQTSPHASRQRAAVSNAPVATLGADLYQQTHNRSYLRWARRIFAWTNRVLLDHRTGLYDDHIDGNGRLSTVKRSYVQGVEIGAMTALHQSEPRAYPLSETVHFAERTMAYFSNCNTTGSAEFRAVYFQNLLWLAHRAASGRLLADIKGCMVNAIRHLTPQPFLLRNAAGAAEMIALNALPVRAYAKLF